MKINQVVNSIIFLPKKYYAEGNSSIYSLLQESGYFELYSEVNEAAIFEELTQHLECIDQWLIYSENKRTSSGWYFKEFKSAKYLVGYYPPQKNLKTTKYSNKIQACAAFIKREIEAIRL